LEGKDHFVTSLRISQWGQGGIL